MHRADAKLIMDLARYEGSVEEIQRSGLCMRDSLGSDIVRYLTGNDEMYDQK